MSEITPALEQLFDAGSKEGQLLAYRKCLEMVTRAPTELPWIEYTLTDLLRVLVKRIQQQIALLEAKNENATS